MKYGFVPALGTPLDANGNLCKESYAKQIERMLEAGAVGILTFACKRKAGGAK